MRIAIMGTRGIPARYGGFETFAEELGTRLVERGHEVTVFCRRMWGHERSLPNNHRGVSLLYAPTVAHKYLETPLHAISSNLLALKHTFDIVLLCNGANSPFAWMLWPLKAPLFINVDGIERHRSKWNSLGKAWYRLGEWTSMRFATRVISDAHVIAAYYESEYGLSSEIIPYGATAILRPPGATLEEYNLTPGRYILYVSRLEPENNALCVIEAYKKCSLNIPLVIVGDAPYAIPYKNLLREAARGYSVVFTGFQFEEAYQELRSHCLCYVQATEVGGTHPALVEALAYGNPSVVNDTPENREVVGEAALVYRKNDPSDLAQHLSELWHNGALREKLSHAARARASELYSWETVTAQYEELFKRYLSADV